MVEEVGVCKDAPLLETVLWETHRKSCLPGMGWAGSQQQTQSRWDGWVPAAGWAACPATSPGREMALCWHSPSTRDKSTCLCLLALPWHPAECMMASLGVLFPMNSCSCYASGKVPLWFGLNSVLLPHSFSQNRMSSVECEGEILLKYKKILQVSLLLKQTLDHPMKNQTE